MTERPTLHPVILSGGAGTRLWPVSRHLKPKQFQPIASSDSLFSQTITRLDDPRFAPPIILCNQDHRFLVAEEFRAANKNPAAIILEPVARNTAPAIAVAALLLSKNDPHSLMAVFPSDHVIADTRAFYEAVDSAAKAAQRGQMVTFGITPTRAETGYGYIHADRPCAEDSRILEISQFVEKPDQETAQSYLDAGTYYWNSGMFVFRASDFLAELEIHAPDVLASCRKAIETTQEDIGFLRLNQPSFETAPSISIDYAVMEKTDRAVVIPSDFGWSDVGSWMSLHELSNSDHNGNVAIGDVLLHEAKNSYVRSDSRLIAAIGVENLVIVATDDAVLITPADRDQDVRFIVDSLKQSQRSEAVAHSRVFRPWGSYQNLQVVGQSLVKEIVVNPGSRLSLQYHNHRAEHWIVVAGTARVTNGDDVFDLKANQSTYIPQGAAHRLENQGLEPLHLIEVQTGTQISEDDIVRIEDDFGRT